MYEKAFSAFSSQLPLTFISGRVLSALTMLFSSACMSMLFVFSPQAHSESASITAHRAHTILFIIMPSS